MATATDHVRAALKDFRERNGRDPETIDDYREIKDAAKEIALIEEPAEELPGVMPLVTRFMVRMKEA